MKTVWKFEGQVGSPILLPEGRVIMVQQEGMRPDLFMVWVEVFPSPDMAMRSHQVFGTGHDIPIDADWVASWVAPPYVWHLYRMPS